MRREDFEYALPRELVAQQPLAERDGSRLFVLNRRGSSEHRDFRALPNYLTPDDVLVLNDTKVIPARLIGRVEALLIEPAGVTSWRAWLKPSRRLAVGDRLEFQGATAVILGHDVGSWTLDFGEDIRPKLSRIGRPPLPPYIKRAADDSDRDRYQTVYARHEGSIAAPTAGLHFTQRVLDRLPCPVVRITLHVGVGTFKPLRCDTIEDHRMDPERYVVSPKVWRQIQAATRVVAVGTTVVRTLETVARTARFEGASDLFIYPPFEFKIVGAMVTNFHVPGGTPLLLACAFAGRERLFEAYREAIRLGYRFFSYGDAMLIT